jgi:type III pantothenate kinase
VIIVGDVGNTETTIGVFDGDLLVANWRLTTNVPRTRDEILALVRALLSAAGIDPRALDGVAIGSVVPQLTAPLREALAGLTPTALVYTVDASSPLPITLDVEEPSTVGADRIINTLAASRLFGRDAIVVDLGTATTFDCITRDGVFLGGVIAPGVITSAETLFRRTSKLPATELVAPDRVIGRRTEACIRSGVMFGTAESVDGIVRRIKSEWPGSERPLVVGTGGLAETFHPLCGELEMVDPHLTLTGLRMAFQLLREGDLNKSIPNT